MTKWLHDSRTISAPAVVAAALLGVATIAAADCPPRGSGTDGVNEWAAANCGPSDCFDAAVTCNGQFSIELLDVQDAAGFVTFTYEVCQLRGRNSLSHWSIGLKQIAKCIAPGYDLSDFVVSATLDGEVTVFEVGRDPTTKVKGVKFDEGVPDKGCHIWTVTFDTLVLMEGHELGVGCAVASTKAGRQDIRREGRPTPGYACIAGPDCEDGNNNQGPCLNPTSAWSDGQPYNPDNPAGATYTAYEPDLLVPLLDGTGAEAGSVHFAGALNGTHITITVMLNPGFQFRGAADNVQVQDYDAPPGPGDPDPSTFDFKGTATESPFFIVVPLSGYYGVHVDLDGENPCE